MEILQFVFLSIPYILALGLALIIAIFGGAVIGRPIVPLVLYMAVFFIFAQSTYGSLEVRAAPTIYFRGVGQLFFPALLWGLLVVLVWTWMGRKFAGAPPVPTPSVVLWLWGWFALLLTHTAWGVFSGHEWADILSVNGFVNIVWMLPLIVLMVWSGRDEKTLIWVARLLVLTTLAKSLFGLGRWAFFGGDKSNVYLNFSRIEIKLTFFDIGDNLVLMLGAAVAVSLLLIRRETARNRLWDSAYALTVVLALACITLSYRRTAWVGLALAAMLLIWKMNARARVPVILAVLPLAIGGIVYAASLRLGARSQVSGIMSFIYDLISSQTGAETQRALELRLAWEAFATSPIVGIGSWGRFASSNLIAWQDQTSSAGAFLHSGVLLIAMKAGLIGLILLGGLGWAFLSHVRRLPRELNPTATALVMAGCCGLLFMLPDMLIGTPFRQVRTTQLIAFCLGLPFMVAVALKLKLNGK